MPKPRSEIGVSGWTELAGQEVCQRRDPLSANTSSSSPPSSSSAYSSDFFENLLPLLPQRPALGQLFCSSHCPSAETITVHGFSPYRLSHFAFLQTFPFCFHSSEYQLWLWNRFWIFHCESLTITSSWNCLKYPYHLSS